MNMWHSFVEWLWSWFFPAKPLWKSCHVSDLPSRLRERCVYLVAEGDQVWQVAMLCPCGCGEIIQLCAVPESRPSWAVTEHPEGTVTLSPSVWRTTGCRSHFFLRAGQIRWC